MKRRTKIVSLAASFAMMVTSVVMAIMPAKSLQTATADWLATSPSKPTGYAYSFAVVGDPQIIARSDVINGTKHYNEMYQWIVDNQTAHNIQFVLNMGDIIDRDGYTESTTRPEWEVAVDAHELLETAGIPYTLVRGNHDNRSKYYDYFFGDADILNRTDDGTKGEYESKYSTSKYTKNNITSNYMDQATMVDCFPKNDYRSARNTAHEYTIGNVKYLVVALDYGAQNAELEWANDLVGQEKYKDYNVIVQTHAYMHGNGKLLDYNDTSTKGLSATYSLEKDGYATKYAAPDATKWEDNAKLNAGELNDGIDIWEKFVKKHANISMVLCGHVTAEDIVHTTKIGDNGNVVHQLVVNPQVLDVVDNDGDGIYANNKTDDTKKAYDEGDMTGMVAIFYCSADGRTIDVRYYSTLQEKYWGEENQFGFSLDLEPWTEGEGMTFTTSELYAMKKLSTVLPRTLEVNLKYTQPSANQMIFSNFQSGATFPTFALMATRTSIGTNTFRLYYRAKFNGSSFQERSVDFKDVAIPDEYHTYAFTFDNENAYCYVDGVLAGTVAHKWYYSTLPVYDTNGKLTTEGTVNADPYPTTFGNPFAVGGDFRDKNGAAYTSGTIRWLQVFSDVRTPAEIQSDVMGRDTAADHQLISLDLTGAKKDGRDIPNDSDKNNPLVLASKPWDSSESGYIPTQENLYQTNAAISKFPKTIAMCFSYTDVDKNRMALASFADGSNASYDAQFALRVVNHADGDYLGLYYRGKSDINFTDVKYAGQGVKTYVITLDDAKAYCYVDGSLKQEIAHTWGDLDQLKVPTDLNWTIGGDQRNNNVAYLAGSEIHWVAMYSDTRTENIGQFSNGIVSAEDCMYSKSFTAGQGLTFVQNEKYVMKKALAELPKTIEITMKWTVPSGENDAIISNYSGGTGATFMLSAIGDSSADKNGGLVLYYKNDAMLSEVRIFLDSPTVKNYADGNYHDYAIVRNDGQVYCYIDGVAVNATVNANGEEVLTATDTILSAVSEGEAAGVETIPSLPYCIGGDYRKANGGYFATGAVKKITMFSDARTASEIETDRTKMDLDDDHIMVALDLTVANMKEGDIRNYADLTNPLYAPGIKFNSGELYQIVGRLKSIPRTIETVIQQGPSDNTEGWIASNFRTNSYPAWGVKLLSNGNIYLYTNHLEKNANGSNRSVEKELTFEGVDVRSHAYKHITITLDYNYAYLYVDGVLAHPTNGETLLDSYGNDVGHRVVFEEKSTVDGEEMLWPWYEYWQGALPMCIGGSQESEYQTFSGRMKSIALYSDHRYGAEIRDTVENGIDVTDPYLISAYDLTYQTGAKFIVNMKKDAAPLISNKHVFANETYIDVADFAEYTKEGNTVSFEDQYIMGLEHTNQKGQSYLKVDYALWDGAAQGDTANNIGVEFRMKSETDLRALLDNAGYTGTLWSFVNVRLGYSFIEINLNNDLTAFGIRAAYFYNAMHYYDSKAGVFNYNSDREYVFRFTRTAVYSSLDGGDGALIRVYIGEIDPETGMPATGWDAKPVYSTFALHERNSDLVTETTPTQNYISIQTGRINHKDNMLHTMTYSSNKYVGVAFDLDGNDVFDSEVTKLNRGASAKYDFSDSNLGEDNNILVGYSQGGETYSADDFVPAAKDYHVKNSIFAKKALSYTLVEPEQASLAYRRVKDENGVLQDPEVALRWSFELSNFTDLVNYFGAADFGYRMWAKDTEGKTKASKETFDILTVEKGSALTSEKLNVSKVNLQLSDYNTQFLARAIARFGYMENGKFVPVTDTVYSSGMTYKGTTPDSLKKDISGSFTKDEKTNKGRSAAYVAQKAIDDARSEPTEEAGFNYCNAIVTADGKTKYHYLTQAQYKMLLDIVNAA